MAFRGGRTFPHNPPRATVIPLLGPSSIPLSASRRRAGSVGFSSFSRHRSRRDLTWIDLFGRPRTASGTWTTIMSRTTGVWIMIGALWVALSAFAFLAVTHDPEWQASHEPDAYAILAIAFAAIADRAAIVGHRMEVAPLGSPLAGLERSPRLVAPTMQLRERTGRTVRRHVPWTASTASAASRSSQPCAAPRRVSAGLRPAWAFLKIEIAERLAEVPPLKEEDFFAGWQLLEPALHATTAERNPKAKHVRAGAFCRCDLDR